MKKVDEVYEQKQDTVSLYNHGAFDTLISPTHRAFARYLATARSLRDAAVDGTSESFKPAM